jgi:hypothetical protein
MALAYGRLPGSREVKVGLGLLAQTVSSLGSERFEGAAGVTPMALDEASLHLQVVSWSQTITHGENRPKYQLRVIARTSSEEKLLFGADGHERLSDRHVRLEVDRGQPDDRDQSELMKLVSKRRALAEMRERGLDGVGELISPGAHGWFWLPEPMYDEICTQLRGDRYDKCVVELVFRPVEWDGDTRRWNTVKNNIVSITSASVRFECESAGFVRRN